MKKKISKWLSILLPILLGVFLIFYSYQKFTSEQIEEIKNQFRNANYNYIYISLVIGFISHFSRAYRWKYTLEHLGYQSKIYNNFMAVWIAYLMNMTIPKSGEFFRALVLNKYEKVPLDKGFGTIVSERIVDFMFLLLFIITALLLQFNTLKTFLLEHIPIQKLTILLTITICTGIAFILILLYSKWKFVTLIKQKIAGLQEGLLSVFKMRKKWPFILHSLLIWISYILMFYVTIFALPETSDISFGVIITSFVAGSLAISFTNGGFGAYPFLIAKILFLYNIPETAGTAFGWIVWTSQLIMVVLFGSLSFLLLPVFNRNK